MKGRRIRLGVPQRPHQQVERDPDGDGEEGDAQKRGLPDALAEALEDARRGADLLLLARIESCTAPMFWLI